MCYVTLSAHSRCGHSQRYRLNRACAFGFSPVTNSCRGFHHEIAVTVLDSTRPLCERCFRGQQEGISRYYDGMTQEIEWSAKRFGLQEEKVEEARKLLVEMKVMALEELARECGW